MDISVHVRDVRLAISLFTTYRRHFNLFMFSPLYFCVLEKKNVNVKWFQLMYLKKLIFPFSPHVR